MFNLPQKFQGGTKKRKRWLFHATDFQSLMYLNLTFSKILGIFPYKINTSNFHFEISTPQYVLWIVSTCVICAYELLLFYEVNFSERIKFEVPRTVTYNMHCMLKIFIIVVWHVLSGPRIRLLQTIQKLSSRLSPESYKKLSKLFHMRDIVSFLFLLWQVIVISFLKRSVSEVAVDTLFEPLRLYIAMVVFQMDMLYVNCVCILKACFEEINNNLENLRELMINKIDTKWNSHKERYSFFLKLKSLKKQHLMVSDTVQMLNIIFSLQLLATIIIVFKQITFFLYFHIVQWQGGISISLDKHIHSDYLITYMMYYISRITLIAWACETGKNQAVKIGTTVHDVLNITKDEQIKYELQLFSLQILHCNNTFWAKGITIDATLLTTMVSGIVTYLLILIQFMGISHSCDEKTAISITKII